MWTGLTLRDGGVSGNTPEATMTVFLEGESVRSHST